MSASFFGILKNHNHTSTVGDGGTLTSLSVASGLTVSTGDLTVTAGKATAANPAAAATDLPQLAQAMVLSLLG